MPRKSCGCHQNTRYIVEVGSALNSIPSPLLLLYSDFSCLCRCLTLFSPFNHSFAGAQRACCVDARGAHPVSFVGLGDCLRWPPPGKSSSPSPAHTNLYADSSLDRRWLASPLGTDRRQRSRATCRPFGVPRGGGEDGAPPLSRPFAEDDRQEVPLKECWVRGHTSPSGGDALLGSDPAGSNKVGKCRDSRGIYQQGQEILAEGMEKRVETASTLYSLLHCYTPSDAEY